MQSTIDVAIIGAGPYGLALATHLSKRGVEHRIFGPPMHAWSSMSPGMYLKSLGFATNIYTPDPNNSLPDYCRARGLEDYEPIEIATFASYGAWVQRRLVPHVEAINVSGLRRHHDMFAVTLESDERVLAKRVVVAVGLSYFERMPQIFDGFSRELVSHTAQHGDFSPFSGSDVTVLGAGQSALQAAALLHEHGAQVRIVARRGVSWGGRVLEDPDRPLLDRLRMPLSVLGHGRDNWVLQHIPMLMHYFPTDKRLRFTRTHLGPGGAWWLRERVEGKMPILQETTILGVTTRNGKVVLDVQEGNATGREIITDHVIAGTGYTADVDRITFIDPLLAKEIRRLERAPDLSRHFESTARGLYFVGPASAASFGPLFRFVAGAAYAAPVVARHLARRHYPTAAASRHWPSSEVESARVGVLTQTEIERT